MTVMVTIPGLDGATPLTDQQRARSEGPQLLPLHDTGTTWAPVMLTDTNSVHFNTARAALTDATEKLQAAQAEIEDTTTAEDDLRSRLNAGDTTVTIEQLSASAAGKTRAELLHAGAAAHHQASEEGLGRAELLTIEDEARAHAGTLPTRRLSKLKHAADEARKTLKAAAGRHDSVRAGFSRRLSELPLSTLSERHWTNRVAAAVAAADQARTAHSEVEGQAAAVRGDEAALMDRLRGGDATVTAAQLALATAERERAELLLPATGDRVAAAARAVQAALAADIRAEADAYAATGAAANLKQLEAAVKAAEAKLEAARAEFNGIVVSIGIRVRNAGGQNAALIRHVMPDGPERDQAVGWVGVPPNPFTSSVVPHHAYGYSVGVEMYTDSEMQSHAR